MTKDKQKNIVKKTGLSHVVRLVTTCGVGLFLLSFFSCQQEDNLYHGPDYIQFADTLTTLPVMDNDSVFDVVISAMHTTSYDRTVAVELLAEKSNAVQGLHFDILNHTAVIAAGELTTNIKVRGYTDKLTVTDSLGFVLQLVVEDKVVNPLYGTQTTVMLQKACRYDINNFTGYALVESTWIYNYMPTISSRLIKVEKDPKIENRVVLKNLYYEGYDVTLDLTTHNILTPDIHFEDQAFAPTTEAFGTIYGNGKIMMREPSSYVSYYSSCERFFIFYTYLYVDDYPEEGQEGVVGNFVHVLKFVTDDEAELLRNSGVDY
ncbi:MAG: DUF4984 domain-containing protein [Bacteroidaceae bacterium]|nr:DUF4984 domain-containing protein [Bacteroidaceae bacterium]